MLDRLREDVRTARETDPAATSAAEVLLYAGLHAVWCYRLAHWLWEREFRLTARALSQAARFLTGVEIHPGAELGRRVFIDHGMGVVVGETAAVGDDVNMYHGVTLGGDDHRPVKRHPTVRDRATLGANATLVGDITIGEDATVGAGAVVVEDVPPGATVVGNPAQRVDDGAEDAADGEREANGERENVPAPGSAASDTDPAESGHDAGLAETDADFGAAEDGAVPESGSPCCDAARSS